VRRKERRFRKGCKPNSVPLLNGENHLSAQPIPETRSAFAETGAGRSGGFLFGLAPDGVFRAASLTLRAVRSYRTFSPSPPVRAGGCLFSVALSVGGFVPRTRVSLLSLMSKGYAASRPLVFGLSSPGSRRERFSALPKPRASYRLDFEKSRKKRPRLTGPLRNCMEYSLTPSRPFQVRACQGSLASGAPASGDAIYATLWLQSAGCARA
jgi:hypothetical protein